MRATFLLSLIAGLAAAPLQADCPVDAEATAAAILEAWRARATVEAPRLADPAAALCVQEAVWAGHGAPLGWKVGLTSRAAQEAFGVDEPVAGRLFEGMLLPDDAIVPRDFGGRPVAEADLVVTVRDAGVMEATTPLEVLAHLESLSPFIELADLMIIPGQPLDADIITAINVGARAGVRGAPVALEATAEWETALANMTVRIEGADEAEIGTYPGAAILGHPLNAVLWLTERLAASGERLGPGDIVSLGSFGPPMPPEGLDGLTVRYFGLPVAAAPAVSLTFE